MSRFVLILGVVLLGTGALLATWLARAERGEARRAAKSDESPLVEPTPLELQAASKIEPEVEAPGASAPPLARRSALAEDRTETVGVVARPAELAHIRVTVSLPPGVRVSPERPWSGVLVSCSLPSKYLALDSLGEFEKAGDTLASGSPRKDGTFEVERAPLAVGLVLEVRNPYGPRWIQRTEPLLAGERREVRVELETGITVSGQIVDEHGEPVEGARVAVRPPEASNQTRFLPSDTDPETDAEGRFQLERLARRSWRLQVLTEFASAEELVIDGGTGDVAGLVLHVVRGSCIEGRVSWPDGRAAHYSAVTASGVSYAHDSTDSDGRFRLCALRPGTYDVRVEAQGKGVLGRAQISAVPAGGAALEIVLEEASSFELSGIVVNDAGGFVENSEVRWTSAAGARGSESLRVGSARSVPGSFLLQGLPAGELEIVVRADGYQSARQTAVVGAHPARSLRFVLHAAGSVRGQVVDAGGRPVSDAQVLASGGGDAVSQSDGRFEIQPHSARTTLQASKPGYAASERFAFDGGPQASLEGIVLRLRESCRVIGRVLDADGRAAAGVFVSAQDLGSYPVTTDARGSFVLDGLPTGEAKISAWIDGALARATLAVEPHRPAEVELRFEKPDPVQLQGRITRAGRPLACKIQLYCRSFVTSSVAVDDGRLELTLPRHGEWTGTVWFDGVRADPERDDVRGFKLVVPDAELHEFALDFDALERVRPGERRGY